MAACLNLHEVFQFFIQMTGMNVNVMRPAILINSMDVEALPYVSKCVLELMALPTFSIAANIGTSGPRGCSVAWKALELDGERMV